jgi:hypothetical protein
MDSLNLAARAGRWSAGDRKRATAIWLPRWLQWLPRLNVEPELHAGSVEPAPAPAAAYATVGAAEQPEHVRS